MIDAHCHLNFHSFERDYDEVIKKAKADGVEIIINVGTKVDSSERAVELAQQYDNLYAIVGVHPHHADKLEEDWIERLENLTRAQTSPLPHPNPREVVSYRLKGEGKQYLRRRETKTKIVAIGEIGLDYFSYQSNSIVNPKIQKDVFEQQIVLANKLKLPLQIHNRHAGKDIIEILRHHKNLLLTVPGMFHCFAGTIEILREVLDLGFYVGFDGNITYKGLAPGETISLFELATYTPLDRIVTETDSPFLTPVPHRGTRGIPSYVIIVGETIARIKNLPFEKVKQQTTMNAKQLFHLQ